MSYWLWIESLETRVEIQKFEFKHKLRVQIHELEVLRVCDEIDILGSSIVQKNFKVSCASHKNYFSTKRKGLD